MTARHAHAGSEPQFIGRDAEMAAALDAAATRPGLLVVVGATWVGTTRFATELAARLEADGAVVVRPRGEGTLAEQLGEGLTAADLRADPVKASQLRPFAAMLDDLDATYDETWEIARDLVGTPGLVIGCMREIPTGPGFVALEPLPDESAAELLDGVAPALDEATRTRLLVLAGGRPGALVPLGRLNRRPMTDDANVTISPAIERTLRPIIDDIDPLHADLAQWASALGAVFDPSLLARLTGRRGEGFTRSLDALSVAGIIEEVSQPGPMRMRFVDPLVAEVIRQSTPPSELRRRHRAILNNRRALGQDVAEMVGDAIGSADPAEIVSLSLRAAITCRERGDAEEALAHANRAIDWTKRSRPEDEQLEARFEQGLALGGLGRWDEASEVLRDVIRKQRRAGREAAALRAITAWTRVRWYAGYHEDALELFEQNIAEGDEPLPERAQALYQAAMFAVHEGRHHSAIEWATRSRAEAEACGDKVLAIRALDVMGLAEVFSSASPEGLVHFRTAFQEARAAGSWRQMAVSLNSESVSLLMLGMVRHAADRAQEGLDLAEAHRIGEVSAPLAQNLAEASIAMGRFADGRRAAIRSRDAYEAMGSRALEPLNALLAWIDFCQGKVPEALAALRQIVADTSQSSPLEASGLSAALYAHVAHAAGEVDEARTAVRAGLERRGGTEDRLDTMTLLGAACQILPAGETKGLLEELVESADAGSPLATALVPYARAWTARGRVGRATAFRDAAAKFDEAGWRWWSARSRMLAGEAAADDPAGIDDLLEARRVFRDIDAPGWRARCEAELRTRGHRFVMPSHHRDDAGLTPREIQVLEEVALGLTNREIASRLYLSEKTVGRHMERIFTKLDVKSRTAAVSAAVDRGIVTEVADHLVLTGYSADV